MIGARLPSLQKQYDEYWSGDPAFIQPPDDATPAQRKEHAQKLQVARETGDWSPLLVDGMLPTKFVMRPLRGGIARKLVDNLTFAKLGRAELAAIAFRAAVVSIENVPDRVPAVTQVHDGEYGSLANEDVSDALDGMDLAIVGELGGLVLDRARGPSPKR